VFFFLIKNKEKEIIFVNQTETDLTLLVFFGEKLFCVDGEMRAMT